MRCITLTQPYATLIAIGAKRCETRSWSTGYRGPLAIHAAMGLGPVGGMRGLRDLCCREPFKAALYAGGIDLDQVDVDVLPRGAIVAVCDLVDCVPTWPGWASKEPWFIGEGDSETWQVPPPEPERSFGDYTPGRFGWLLGNIRALPEPAPCKGALGLWNYEGVL